MAERDKPTDENFLGRWSRLKRRRETEPPRPGEPGVVVPDGMESAPAQPVAADLPDLPDPSADGVAAAEAPAVEDLPDVDSLDADSDYTGFLKPGVPEILRRKALRTLWRSNPVFANLDGLNDYDEDFSAIGIIAQEVSSLYKVGKGMLADADTEPEREGERDEDEARASSPDAPESETAAPAPTDPHRQTSDDSETSEDPETDGA